ncbi:phage tail spike protein [Cytobacillus kochii]|uniref:phage tail spike protein n=1 Tax=Cytobacillus kochii TaxID=859143 RepID=UPI003F808944
MAELYLFNQDDKQLTIISEDSGLISAPYRIEVNKIPETPFSFTVEADSENAKYVLEENKVVFRDHEGDLRLFVIKELDDSDGMDGALTTATCEPEFLELAEHIILDKRFSDKTAQVALDAALEATGWIGEVEVDLGLASTNFYRMRSVDAIWEIIKVWGGEFKDVVEFDEENNIVARKIKIIQRLGKDTGQRFEIDHNTTEIGRQVLSYPVTAMYGWGASLEIEDEEGNHTGGYSRYIDFGDIEKSIANGDPFDKPKGQKWVGDPEAFASYRRIRDGVELHREGEFYNQDYEDPEELLWATWQHLQDNKHPVVNYRLSVDLLDDKVSLGDTVIAIDRKFSRPIEIQSRIIAMEYDLLDIDGTTVVEMGQFLELGEDRLQELEEEVQKIKDRPKQITEGSYPDIKPGTPVNLETAGGIEVIQLYWEYASNINLKHYEVYGSQIEGFVPDTQHLLWRGDTSAFAHNVGTDQLWYYRVRAVNYHGTPSDWSVQVMGATHRVISDDILFGPELAARLRQLSETAQTIADGTISLDHLDGTIINGNRIHGDLIAIDGTTYIGEGVIGSAAIANAAISRAKLQDAIIGTAQIDDLAVTAAKIASVNADRINVGALRGIDVYGAKFRSSDGLTNLEIIGGNVRLTQSSGQYVNVNPDGLFGYNSGGSQRFSVDRSLVTSAALGTSNSNVYLAPDSTNEVRVVDISSIPSDGVAENYSYRPIRAQGLRFGPGYNGYIGTDREVRITSSAFTQADGSVVYRDLRASVIYGFGFSTNSTNAYIGSDDETRFVNKGYVDGSSGNPVYRNARGYKAYFAGIATNTSAGGTHLYLGANGDIRATGVGMADEGSIIWRRVVAAGFQGNYIEVNPNTNGTHFYVRSNGEVQATASGTTGTYIPIRAASFPTGSMASYKEDIKEWTDSALDIINRSTIYQYRLKREVESGHSRVRQGLVIGEGYQIADELIDGDGVEQYLMNSINMKGIQELDKRTLGHAAEINWLKIENQYLKNRITYLENLLDVA